MRAPFKGPYFKKFQEAKYKKNKKNIFYNVNLNKSITFENIIILNKKCFLVHLWCFLDFQKVSFWNFWGVGIHS